MARITLIEKERAAMILRSLYENAERQYGFVPNFYKAMVHRPELLVTFANFQRELWTGGGVDIQLKGLTGLRAAVLSGCPYCTAHRTAGAVRSGVSQQKIAEVRDGSHATTPVLDERERAVIRLAEKIMREPGSVTEEDLRQLRKWFGEADLVELVLLVGATNLTSRFNLCFATQLEPMVAKK